eukprot:9019099-Pyramimonas_sp.AAC.1
MSERHHPWSPAGTSAVLKAQLQLLIRAWVKSAGSPEMSTQSPSCSKCTGTSSNAARMSGES